MDIHVNVDGNTLVFRGYTVEEVKALLLGQYKLLLSVVYTLYLYLEFVNEIIPKFTQPITCHTSRTDS